MSRKTEIYTWRVSPETKAHLEETARRTNRSIAQVLDEIVTEHLSSTDHASESEVEQQRQLHACAGRLLGSISGFTIDHNDFETYRVGGRKRLRILPSR